MADIALSFDSSKSAKEMKEPLKNLETYVLANYSKYGPEMLAQYMEPVAELSSRMKNKEIEEGLRATYITPAKVIAVNRGAADIGMVSPRITRVATKSRSREDMRDLLKGIKIGSK
jgi:hypothetical protein